MMQFISVKGFEGNEVDVLVAVNGNDGIYFPLPYLKPSGPQS
jgi:hypothetical protein